MKTPADWDIKEPAAKEKAGRRILRLGYKVESMESLADERLGIRSGNRLDGRAATEQSSHKTQLHTGHGHEQSKEAPVKFFHYVLSLLFTFFQYHLRVISLTVKLINIVTGLNIC